MHVNLLRKGLPRPRSSPESCASSLSHPYYERGLKKDSSLEQRYRKLTNYLDVGGVTLDLTRVILGATFRLDFFPEETFHAMPLPERTHICTRVGPGNSSRLRNGAGRASAIATG